MSYMFRNLSSISRLSICSKVSIQKWALLFRWFRKVVRSKKFCLARKNILNNGFTTCEMGRLQVVNLIQLFLFLEKQVTDAFNKWRHYIHAVSIVWYGSICVKICSWTKTIIHIRANKSISKGIEEHKIMISLAWSIPYILNARSSPKRFSKAFEIRKNEKHLCLYVLLLLLKYTVFNSFISQCVKKIFATKT